MQITYLLKFNLLLLLTLLMLSFYSSATFAEKNISIRINPETEIDTTIYRAKGDTLFLWLYSEAGPQKNDHNIAKQLAKKNVEVWLIDLFAAHFLPVAASSMDRIPASDVSALIQYAFIKTGKKIIPVTTGRGSLPILNGTKLWQSQYQDQRALAGVILMSPKFFLESPEPGEEATLLDVVEQTNLPLFILQPQLSPWFWKLDQTIPALEKSGSDVFVQRIKNVRDRYYFRPDANAYENKLSLKLATTLKRAANYLLKLTYKKRTTTVKTLQTKQINSGKKARKLSPYKGITTPPELILKTLKQKTIDLKNLKGMVVLVNFWATWCPPCVHEMPSMERLQKRFSSKVFTILGVNMAEGRKNVHHFLNSKVKVSFPILFDENGDALKRWNVFAFPTSYVIGKQGKIRYAILGGVDWENKDIVHKITELIHE